MKSQKETIDLVKKAYGDVAKNAGRDSSCCGPTVTDVHKRDKNTEGHPVPEAELGLGCGSPLAFSEIKDGDVVLDLGSGAGNDVFQAGPKTGKSGRVIGVDMTVEMLDLANRNLEKYRASTGLDNVEFRGGQIENLPVDDDSIDLIISNCVINLSPDKPQVFREAYRVLKSGGRIVVSDIVLNKNLPESVLSDEFMYSACISGAMKRGDYLDAIKSAGFDSVEILTDRKYTSDDFNGDPITCCIPEELEAAASSITVKAIK